MTPGIPKFRKESHPERANDNEDQFFHTFSDLTAHVDSTEVDLLTRSGSVADPIVKDLFTAIDKPSSIKVHRLVRLTYQAPPLKREDGVGRPPWTTACP